VLSITIVSDAPNCDHHYDDRNSFIIQATGEIFQASMILDSKAGTYPGGASYGSYSKEFLE
jgi:hypothetical protein